MNRKNQKKFSLKPEGSSENLVFSLPSIDKKPGLTTKSVEPGLTNKPGLMNKPGLTEKTLQIDKEPSNNLNNYNFINVDYQKKLSQLFGNSLSESEKTLIMELFSKIEEQRKELDQRNTTLMAIQRNFESLSMLCKNEKTLNQDLQRKSQHYEAENEGLLAKLHILTEEISHLKELNIKNLSLLEDKTKSFDKTIREHQQIAIEVVSLKGILKEKDEKYTKLMFLNEGLKEEISLKNEEINGYKVLIGDVKKEKIELEEAIKKNEGGIIINETKMNGIFNELKGEISLKNLEINGYKALIEDMKEEKSELEGVIMKKEGNISINDIKIDGLTNEIKEKSKEIGLLRDKCRRYEENNSQFMQSKLNGEELFRQENERLRGCLKDKDAEIERYRDSIRKLEEKGKKNEENMLEFTMKSNAEMNEIKEKLIKYEGIIRGHQERVRVYEEEINGLKGKIQALEKENRGKGVEDKRKDEEIGKYKEKIEYFQGKSIDLTGKIKEKEKEINEKNKEIERILKEIEEGKKEKEMVMKENQRIFKEKEEIAREIQRVLEENKGFLKEKEGFLKEIKEKDEIMKENLMTLKEKNNLLKERDSLVKEKDTIFHEKSHILKEKDILIKENNEKCGIIKEKDIKIKQISLENQEFLLKIQELEELIKKLNPERLEILKKSIDSREMALKNVVAKLVNAEESLIANLSCTYCLELLNKPVICFPCGHSFCEKCKSAYETVCFECKHGKEPKVFKNKLFEEILTKIQYIRTTTEALGVTTMYNSFKN